MRVSPREGEIDKAKLLSIYESMVRIRKFGEYSTASCDTLRCAVCFSDCCLSKNL